jgi:hypothetical protein
MATTAVLLAKVAVVDLVRLAGLQFMEGIITALGHCLGVHLHWLMTVLCTQFQPL